MQIPLETKVVKFSTPWALSFLSTRLPDNKCIGGYHFEIDNDCDICDYWIVWGDLGQSDLKRKVKAGKTIFLTDEVHEFKNYPQKFTTQFDSVITPRNDINHRNIINSHELNTWHINKTYSQLETIVEIPKSKNISVVCSDLTDLPGHKARYTLVNRLIGHFKDRLDVFGRGLNPIQDKWDALAPYKYSIAIENNSFPGYFTEKLSECYLTLTMPVYYGCKDIDKYFDAKSILNIDIDDYRQTINQIEQLLDEDPYPQQLPLLIEQKNRFLKNYNIFNALSEILTREFGDENQRSANHSVKLNPQNFFIKYRNFKQIRNNILKAFGN